MSCFQNGKFYARIGFKHLVGLDFKPSHYLYIIHFSSNNGKDAINSNFLMGIQQLLYKEGMCATDLGLLHCKEVNRAYKDVLFFHLNASFLHKFYCGIFL